MKLYPLTEKELEQIFSIRNMPSVRECMFNTSEISLENHLNWFSRYQLDDSKETYVLKNDNQDLIGVVNFNFLTSDKKLVDWGFYVSPTSNKGTGTVLLTLALEKLFNEYQVEKVFGQAIGFNERSINIHKKLGFKLEGILRKHYQRDNKWHDIYEFGLLKEEYLIK